MLVDVDTVGAKGTATASNKSGGLGRLEARSRKRYGERAAF